ncbi:hypothetical protein SPRG_10701 [Saprolegnia parasitica CBS 223.65]|uniref:Apoptosis-antagonizing transcription factor C-terminal domain-containing protein n=1 Tax=Saprolegnia parasitica (strain CBS 223.65) TaxID=695850 RepID=A0A067C4D5_SAPPC|nr:hypothetical protein SPRG_10701 [Saprolegnia parasitica CBS 223.65]KDO24005.1 hypothetical protein SPRG_10701 [Saprolegnia parasitica CBS 223.65]|eukprot:XP_012205324.1 hypothetical protein SPRG_10701 [Saprolegnia parasitica CBS 223.65]
MVGRMKGLAKSKRVFTVDDDEYDDGTAAATYSGSESEADGHDDGDDDEIAMRPASSLRVRNSNFDDADPAYEGKVVRRTELKSDDDDDEEDLEREMQDEWSEGEPFAGSDGDDQSGSDLDEEEEEDESEEENEDTSAVGGDVDDVIRALEEEDAAVLMRSKDIETQQHKAKHVHHQKMIWERCLELQIAIKQLIATINGVGTSGSDEESAKRSALAAQLRSCMATMHAMQQEMYTLPEFSTSSKRSMDEAGDMWQGCVDESAAALPQYQSILNKYARQADGVAAKKFKAVNQDVLVQVDAVLADPQRIRRKAHPAAIADDTTDSEAVDDLQYDDREFYQQLLKEYIENGANGLDASLGASLKLKRKKKNVNRKASKGRVVKYTVMPKLQHFMFPDPTLRYKTNMDIDELFRSLFSSTAKA